MILARLDCLARDCEPRDVFLIRLTFSTVGLRRIVTFERRRGQLIRIRIER
jgi:hypothetical protein